MARRFEMTQGQRLDEDVADGRGLDRSGDDGQSGGIGGELVEQMAPAAPADDVKLFELVADNAFQLAQGLRVSQRQAFQNRADELSGCRGHRLGGFPAKRSDLVRHVAGRDKARVLEGNMRASRPVSTASRVSSS